MIAGTPEDEGIIIVVVDTDGIYENFRTFKNVFDLSGSDVTLRIKTIRYHKEDLLVVLRRPHFFHPSLDGIVSRGLAAWLDVSQAALNLLHVGGKMLPNFHVRVKRDDEHLILRRECQRDLTDCLQGLLQFVAHAATAIDQDSHADRHTEIMRKE